MAGPLNFKFRLVMLCRKNGVHLEPCEMASEHLIALLSSDASIEDKREGLKHYEKFIFSVREKEGV